MRNGAEHVAWLVTGFSTFVAAWRTLTPGKTRRVAPRIANRSSEHDSRRNAWLNHGVDISGNSSTATKGFLTNTKSMAETFLKCMLIFFKLELDTATRSPFAFSTANLHLKVCQPQGRKKVQLVSLVHHALTPSTSLH